MARKNSDAETRTQTVERVAADVPQLPATENVEVDHAANAAPADNLLFPPAKDPVTMTASWLSKAEAKVITAKHAERTGRTSAVTDTKADDADGDDEGGK